MSDIAQFPFWLPQLKDLCIDLKQSVKMYASTLNNHLNPMTDLCLFHWTRRPVCGINQECGVVQTTLNPGPSPMTDTLHFNLKSQLSQDLMGRLDPADQSDLRKFEI